MSASSTTAVAAGSDRSAARRGFLLLVAAGVLWGTGGLAGHLLQSSAGLHPLAVAAYRLLLGGLLISVLLAASGRLHRVARSGALVRRILVNGVLHAVFQGLYFASLALVPVGLATLVKIGSVPVFVTVGICLATRRPPGARLGGAVATAVLGLALLAGFPSADAAPGRLAAGLACALGAGLVFSVMTLVNRRPVAGLDPLVNVGLGCLVGGLLLTPAGLWVGMPLPARPGDLALLAFLGLVPTALAYAAYFGGLRSSSDGATAMATITEPLTAALLSMALLGERMTVPGAVGTALLVLAMLAEYAGPRRR
ncbi:DMT family transporter [Marinitenerispora sediminis]|uniref:EamA family transporter n=1 Tax=Marinitenerispora sediminis TaxID=1931232 RepID=A0A368T5N2_9ACTN|nr:DMT family transporter [Marinitenerispora sediminis]RCV53311.1 EamA family transporter [Marinitenerispora sediminis]RCV58527.1 EamA family transporter [Marinitenerispora sediminis]RCV58856.1 EamA family transporter [Marinitenerispora sediminis]